ncbi:uncharacterized protein F5Z01DRAFT_628984, partial [Emericellopsis atlantica]
YYGDCNKSFSSRSALNSHLQSSLHSTDFRYYDCDRQFKSSQSLEQHLRDATHSPKSKHKYKTCHRKFRTAIALKNHHLQSPAQHPLCNLRYNGSLCRIKFSTLSRLIHHLRSGTYSSGIRRKKFNRYILSYNTDRLITRPHHDADGLLLEVNKRLETITQVQNTKVGHVKHETFFL